MIHMRKRATDLLPSVLLTFLSIIQALALELLWTSLRTSPHLWRLDWPALLGWIQVSAILLGILLVWIFYTSLVMRFSWLPSLRDSVLPFAIGLLEFTLIDLEGPGTLGPWFYTLAAVFGVSVWTTHLIFRRVAEDPSARACLESLEPESHRAFAKSIAAVAGLVLIGLLLQVSRNQGWLALAGLLYANAVLIWQLAEQRRFWHATMAASEIDDAGRPGRE